MRFFRARADHWVALVVLSGCNAAPVRTVAIRHPIAAALSTRLSGIDGRPFAVRASNNGVIAVTQQDLNSLTLTDTTNKKSRSVKVGADPGDVVFNNAGTKAYVSAFNQGIITIVDVASAAPIATIPIAANAYRLVLSRDESRLFVTSTDGHVYTVNFSTLAVSSLRLSGALNGCALDRLGQYLYVATPGGTVWKINVSTSAVDATANRGGVVQEVAVAPDGSEVYAANEAGWVDVLDASTLAPLARVAVNGAPFGLAVTLDGSYLYVTSAIGGTVEIINVKTRTAVKTLHVGGTPRRIAFDSSGLTAFVANEGNFVDVIR